MSELTHTRVRSLVACVWMVVGAIMMAVGTPRDELGAFVAALVGDNAIGFCVLFIIMKLFFIPEDSEVKLKVIEHLLSLFESNSVFLASALSSTATRRHGRALTALGVVRACAVVFLQLCATGLLAFALADRGGRRDAD